MSVEVWKNGKCLGIVSERIVEYIDNLEARVKALEAVNKKAVLAPAEIREIMREHNIVIDDLADKMQKFAFTVYTELCSLGSDAEAALEDPDGQ